MESITSFCSSSKKLFDKKEAYLRITFISIMYIYIRSSEVPWISIKKLATALLGWLSFQSSFHLPLGKTSCLRQCYFPVHLNLKQLYKIKSLQIDMIIQRLLVQVKFAGIHANTAHVQRSRHQSESPWGALALVQDFSSGGVHATLNH